MNNDAENFQVEKGWYKKRWKILLRDNFTCQYCGQTAPSVCLEVDHKKPVSEGGTGDDDNLTTSCSACNRGKMAFGLSLLFKARREAAIKLNSKSRSLKVKIYTLMKEKQSPMTLEDISAALPAKQRSVKTILYRMKGTGLISNNRNLWEVTRE